MSALFYIGVSELHEKNSILDDLRIVHRFTGWILDNCEPIAFWARSTNLGYYRAYYAEIKDDDHILLRLHMGECYPSLFYDMEEGINRIWE